ncbi:hypothetical protein K491DRAFT_630243 [Lophiostoma macrostomum CBS 122681]|uniref:Uncharacterized protein n=1 Tax=Lophiostoma macrostomum CBS 122681 TaxID=1314788 RepID=A0A6A6T816_9PLEO|nr:hypothetical protein K491DRAFT_630243 [Lophiostoma macrostomum CBS 122681]
MPAEELESVLSKSDSTTLHERLSKFVSNNESFTADNLAAVAGQYLHAFCDHQRSATDRRWIGLALRKIIEGNPQFADEVNKGVQDVSQVGQVLLHRSEAEETRIVAGIVIREALKCGVKFASCWESDKIPNSIPHFPQDDGETWMQEFQKFLDCFDDLKMVHPNTDPAILYPIAIVARDGYKWRDSDNIIPVVLIQNGMLTVIIPDQRMRNINFVDVPLTHIDDAKLRKSSLHNSQALETDQEPWDLALTLKPGKWTYRVNVNLHWGAELTIIFKSLQDAEEAKVCIWETKNKSSRPRMSSSKGMITIPSLNGTNERAPVDKQKPGETSAQASKENHRANSVEPLINFSSDVLTTTRQEENNIESPEDQQRARMDAAPRSDLGQNSASLDGAESSAGESKTSLDNCGLSAASASRVNARLPSAPAAKGLNPQSSAPALARSKDKGTMNSAVHSETPQSRGGANRVGYKQSVTRNAFSQPHAASRPVHAGEGRSSGLRKPSKALKRRADPASEDAMEDVWAIPNDTRSSIMRRQRRTVVQKVDYNETSSESSEDHSSVSDYMEPISKKRQRLSTNSAPKQRLKSPRHVKVPVTKRKTDVKRTGNTKLQQSISPDKHGIISSLVSSARPSRKIEHTRTAGGAVQPGDGHERSQSPTMERAETETPPTRNSRVVSSEAHILHALADGELAVDEGVHAPSPARSGGTKQAPGIINETRHETILESTTPVVSAPQGTSRTKHPRKRPASTPGPSTPPAKRTRYDQYTIDGFVVEPDTVTQHPTTMAPPRRVRDPPSPCVEATQSRRSSADLRTQTGHSKTNDSTEGFVEEPEVILPLPTPSRQLGVPTSGVSVNNDHTPQHQLVEYEHVFGSADVEILSSNSKPLPGHPEAESAAISGHANVLEIDLEMEMGEYETAKSNPFLQGVPSRKVASFVRRLTEDSFETNDVDASPSLSRARALSKLGRDDPPTNFTATVTNTQPVPELQTTVKVTRVNEHTNNAYVKKPDSPKHAEVTVNAKYTTPVQKRTGTAPRKAVVAAPQLPPHPVLDADEDMDADQTLVADAEDLPPLRKASPVNFRSSPPTAHLASSNHSSTSAGSTPPSERASSMPTEDTEDAEWEASLQPHQRALGDQLLRISKRVLRHVVDHETAVDDIANVFASDGEHLLDEFVQRHSGEYEMLEKGVQARKAGMRNELLGVAKNVAGEMQRYKGGGRGV